MHEPEHFDTSRAWSWRHAIGKSKLPPTTRLVLHTLGLKMDATGGSCYPSVAELVELTGLDKKTVLKHLELAAEKGWIEVSQHGFRGQKWKRNEYVARWPGRDLKGTAAGSDDGERGGVAPPPSDDEEVVELTPEGGGIDGQKVVEPRHQDKNIPENIPENIPLGERASAKSQVLKDDYADEREVREAGKKKQQALERRFWELIRDWPDIKGMPRQNWLAAWLALTDDERDRAERRRDVWLQTLKRQGRTKTYVPGTYLSEKLFDQVDDPSPTEIQKKNRVRVPPFGPGWTGLRMVELMKGAIMLPPPDIDPRDATRQTFQTLHRANPARALAYLERKGVTLGDHGQPVFPPDFLEAEERRRVMAEGFPEVNRLHEAASHRATIETEADISRFPALCEPVPVGSDMWREWADEHARRGWPWVPDPEQMRIVYFPKGGPKGLQEFINAATAANSEAAE